jgi:hypothetical protein
MQSTIEKLKKFEDNIEKKNQEIRDSAGNIRKTIGKLKNDVRKTIGKYKTNIGKNKKHVSDTTKKINKLPYHKIEQWIINNQVGSLESYQDSLSHGQLSSKQWLVNKLPKGKDLYLEVISDGTPTILGYTQHLPLVNSEGNTDPYPESSLYIEIIGGWFGCPLIDLLHSKLEIKKIDFYEKDELCKKILTQYLNHFEFPFEVSIFGDFFERKEIRRRDLIINTSGEHMEDIIKMKHYFKGNPVVAIQSNDYFGLDEHINCVHNVEELIEKNKIKNLVYKGELDFPKYTRYMTIGHWYV